jgi:D-erythronate 2-dehydrogenase
VANVVITGGAGFLGSRLARELLAAGEAVIAGGPPRPLSRLTLTDQVPVPPGLAGDDRVRVAGGDLGELLAGPSPLRDAIAGADLVYHLAAAVSGECEADFGLGMRVNLHGTEALLEACRAAGTTPVVVFASSLAVFGTPAGQPGPGQPEHGAPAGHPAPGHAGDHILPDPQTSYGVQKLIGEHLVADYTRKGFLDGRSVRLMTVSVRPGRPNAAASGFLSGIIREPLAGQRAVCPVPPTTEVALSSPARTIAGLLCAASTPTAEWGGRGAVTLPALTVTVSGMVAALERVAGPEATALIDWVPDPEVTRMFASWPSRVDAARARRLGLDADPDFDSVIRAYLAESAGTPA